ncbi:1-acyl-sn-glycerol-3-phosphate acyltransferase [Neosynechococcus sphagnicola]|nr:1-acyl-sn-glycerol-3-phosphate acyltransferase [Neosynechococcus sphagnicola]
MTQVQPPLEFIPPRFNPGVLRLMQWLLPALIRTQTGIEQIQGRNVEQLVDLYQQFQTGKVRLIMAFRHPSTYDPFCLAYLLAHLVPQGARKQHVPLRSPIHAHFLYDRGIPLWAGEWAGWLYSRLGGISIQRGKIDRQGLRTARELFVNGTLPLIAAPEGATNGHGEIISPLEPGIAQLGFWCVEDLVKAGRSESVVILPIGIQYHYVDAPWEALDSLLQQLETVAGISSASGSGLLEVKLNHPDPSWTEREAGLYQRLLSLGEHILSLMEEFYTRFYHQTLIPPVAAEAPVLSGNEQFALRLQVLLDAALRVAEQYFGLMAKGSVIDRCRRLEQAGWDCIYREDIKQLENLSPLERGLADAIAAEASLRMWHMRLVESFVSVTGRYVREKPTIERFAETTLLMWDLVTRIQGKNPFARPSLGKQQVQITIGTPISVSDRWDTYQANRRSAKQSVTDLTQDLQTALESLIL